MLYKICTKCWIEKPTFEFYKRKDRRGWHWFKSKCKECEREESKNRQQKLRDSWHFNSPEMKEKKDKANKKYIEKYREKINQRARWRNKDNYFNVRYRLLHLWQSMKYRCYNPKSKNYKRYWGKWVIIERKSFDEFYEDMSPSYIEHVKEFWYWPKNTQIDRIDPNGNYSKCNCRRVTAKENNSYNHEREFSY